MPEPNEHTMREPLLSDDGIENICKEYGLPISKPMEDIRDFYEARIRPIPCSERMPPPDTEVLIWSKYCGPTWHHAHHMGEDKDPEEGQPHWNWTIDAAPYSYEEVEATHWMEMPPAP